MEATCGLFIELYENCEAFCDFAERHEASAYGPMHNHHIWGGKTRYDLPSNLILVSHWVHDWAHQHPAWMRVATLWWRVQFSGFRWDELDRAAGCDARGWVDSQTGISQPYARYAAEILERSEYGVIQ